MVESFPAEAILTLFKSASAWELVEHESRRWLDEMMLDANDNNAPQQLKDNAGAVRQYLGIDDDGRIITRLHHRKFAARFERYLLENTAPSKGIARVFAEFKQWLVTIYKAVDQAGCPITSDLRDWYVRALSIGDPEKVVIVPDRASAINTIETAETNKPKAHVVNHSPDDGGKSFWPIFIYFVMSIAIAGSAAFNASWHAGVYTITASFLFLVAGGGLRASLWWGDKAQRIGGTIVAVLLVVLAQWLSRGFSVQLFGHYLSGQLWGWIGFGVCFLFVNKKLAIKKTQ
jgi:hypothetical protein